VQSRTHSKSAIRFKFGWRRPFLSGSARRSRTATFTLIKYRGILLQEPQTTRHLQVRADRFPATASASAVFSLFFGKIEKNLFRHGGHRYNGRHNNCPINFNLPSACSRAILCSSNLPHRRQCVYPRNLSGTFHAKNRFPHSQHRHGRIPVTP
jgi:hypothetical protein